MSDLASRLYEAHRRALHDPTSLPAWGNASTEERAAWERAAEVARTEQPAAWSEPEEVRS